MSSPQIIRLGTRSSQLAMWQSNWVKTELEKYGHQVELIQIKTQGDVATGSLAQIGGQGLFTKRLQIALLENEVDLAVHSLKDLPTEDADGLTIAAIPPRETTRDAFVSVDFKNLSELPENGIVGTGSVRRAAQLRHLRTDLEIKDIRGNVDTRLNKLETENYDAIILAAAGLTRLGWENRITTLFTEDEILPAVGQGALGLETRSDDDATIAAVSQLNHVNSFCRAMAERIMLRSLFAGCLAPVGAKTQIHGDQLTLTGSVLSANGQQKLIVEKTSAAAQYQTLGQSVAAALFQQGAEAILRP
jgi:hydroxymethylbilane synthase